MCGRPPGPLRMPTAASASRSPPPRRARPPRRKCRSRYGRGAREAHEGQARALGRPGGERRLDGEGARAGREGGLGCAAGGLAQHEGRPAAVDQHLRLRRPVLLHREQRDEVLLHMACHERQDARRGCRGRCRGPPAVGCVGALPQRVQHRHPVEALASAPHGPGGHQGVLVRQGVPGPAQDEVRDDHRAPPARRHLHC